MVEADGHPASSEPAYRHTTRKPNQKVGGTYGKLMAGLLLYNFRSRSYWLRRLENHGRKERVPVDEYTIEHILPKIGAKVATYARYVVSQMAEASVPRWLFAAILARMGRLRLAETVPR